MRESVKERKAKKLRSFNQEKEYLQTKELKSKRDLLHAFSKSGGNRIEETRDTIRCKKITAIIGAAIVLFMSLRYWILFGHA